MTENITSSGIFSKTGKEYRSGCDDRLFQQYKAYLRNIDSLENRRWMVNNFFSSINIGLIASLGILIRFGGTVESHDQTWATAGCVVGMLISLLWLQTIISYRSLASVKWGIVLEMEDRLPLKIHKVEWGILKNKKHRKFTHIESIIPGIFILLYVALVISILAQFEIP